MKRTQSALARPVLALLAGVALACADEGPVDAPEEDAAAVEAVDSETRRRARALEGLGYASGMELATDRPTGVPTYVEARCEPGLNLYSSGHAAEAFLIDMEGRTLHRWAKPIESVWPDLAHTDAYFRKVRLLDDGVLLAIFEGAGIVALDRDSNLLWTYDRPAHHDIREDADGTLYALDRRARVVPEFHPTRPLLDDRIVRLTRDGEVLEVVSVLEALLASRFADEVRAILADRIERGLALEESVKAEHAEEIAKNPELAEQIDAIGDIFHSNSLRRLSADEASRLDGLEAGWYLISMRSIDALVAIEIEEDGGGVARWFARGEWKRQHELLPLANGRLLLFDNVGLGPERSRVVEIDPVTLEIEWEYRGSEGAALDSSVGGTCARLANGNTLVVESTQGTACEITPEAEVVWEFTSPHRTGDDDEKVAFLTDVHRIAPEDVEEWLPERGK